MQRARMSKRNRVDGEALRPAGMIPVERVVDAEKTGVHHLSPRAKPKTGQAVP
jgi:hypothetical protein